MSFLGDVWRVTGGIVTGNTNRVERGISGIGDTVGDLLNRATGATQANQWQWDMWQEQNAYNTPDEQMRRLKAAGLNPMLVYGNGSVAGNTASSMSAGSAAGSGALNALGAFLKSPWTVAKMNQDLALGQSQIDQVNANKDVALATAGKIRAETDIIRNQIENTPPGMDAGGSKGPIEKVVRAVYGINKASKDRGRDYIKRHTYNPNLPALGRNYRP